MKLRLFRNNYGITGSYNRNYLQACVLNKQPREGEDWIRGGDLADGKFKIRTALRIIGDIWRCETTGSKYKNK